MQHFYLNNEALKLEKYLYMQISLVHCSNCTKNYFVLHKFRICTLGLGENRNDLPILYNKHFGRTFIKKNTVMARNVLFVKMIN